MMVIPAGRRVNRALIPSSTTSAISAKSRLRTRRSYRFRRPSPRSKRRSVGSNERGLQLAHRRLELAGADVATLKAEQGVGVFDKKGGRFMAARAGGELFCSEPLLKFVQLHAGEPLSPLTARASTRRRVDLFSTRTRAAASAPETPRVAANWPSRRGGLRFVPAATCSPTDTGVILHAGSGET